MNILSLFDGMSCGRIAAERAGLPVTNYYASEVDKHAIKVSQTNWPDIIHLGDVTKWKEWPIDWASIDLLIGGSPCQGFSFAGKQLAFDDPRSALFFVYVDILNHIRSVNPKVKFMLENVKMKNEHLQVITEYLGVEPVFINSNLVSAQNRQRYYWCNWSVIAPLNREVYVRDILDISANNYDVKTVVFNNRVKGVTENDRGYRYNKGDKAKSGISELGRILKPSAKFTDALTTSHSPKIALNSDTSKLNYRELNVVECERIQTVPDGYTKCLSPSQAKKALGNGWTVDVIAHIFRQMLKPPHQQ